ncbi:MAG: AMP-binding protein, partial [Erythrobacter sp.]|nr:AMP-binding protein [Erythrobacter sp.]
MHPISHARSRPDHPAIIMAGSGETMSYGEMDAYANRFAQLLRARGLGRGDHFGVLMENNIHYLPLVWGSQRAGTMMVPVSTRLTAPEICYILKDAGVKVLVTSRKFDDVLQAIRGECGGIDLLILGGEGAEDYEAALDLQPAEPIPDQAPGQYMLYSSGTTGAPKGVRPAPPDSDDIEAVNPLVGLAIMGAGMPADGSMVYLSPAPLYHAASLGW